MFKSQQYRAKAAEYGELAKGSTGSDESRRFQELQERLSSLADNEQGLANNYQCSASAGPIPRRSPCGRRGARSAVSWRGHHHAMERLTDDAATGNLRHRRIGRQIIGDSGPPRADRPISSQAQE
jgi:hypothetical protein